MIRVARLQDDAIVPTRKHPTDAGMDFYSYRDYIISPNTFKIVETEITVEIPRGYFALLKPKSKSNWLVGAGVIDESYQGDIKFKIFNPLDHDIVIRYGDPVGQMVIIPCITPDIEEIPPDEIHPEKTSRGTTGGIVQQFSALRGLGILDSEDVEEYDDEELEQASWYFNNDLYDG